MIKNSNSGLAITGFILSIFGVLTSITLCSLPFAIAGLILSAKGKNSAHPGLAEAGVVISIIALVIFVVWFIMGFTYGLLGG